MRPHLRRLSAVTLVLGLGGCSLVHPPKPLDATATPAAPANTAPDLTPTGEQLQDLLLTAGDLPGYGPMPAGPAGSGGITDLGSGAQQCGGAAAASAAPVASAAPAEAVQVMLAKGMTGPFVAEAIVAPGDLAARTMVADLAAAPVACPNFSGEAAGTGVTVSMSQLTVGKYGDASAGVQLTATPAGLPMSIHGYVISFAHRGIAVTVIVMGLTEIDKAEAEAVVRSAANRVQRAS
ncbi:hypothetical protein [Actinoplanes awajinensis]|uniref:PknH-like extracellular domain-containing protein n=1 Tax=Actinoplanes awajinensis subsp. mycoplanecinus TaxID=135947 RepID=A0A0X3V9A8_9ACTN|nr:hypothetical protein [Actinoplanes awajinensis]KUL41365.1 hypothetical protein ADL15_03680 [Actinoplanes awajinensis subsp. mycoplanecinus]